MSILEILNLLVIVATASCLIVRPVAIRGALKPISIFATVLSILQVVVDGYSWRYLPGYGVLVLIALWAFVGHKVQSKIVLKRVLQFALVISLPVALLPWSIFSAVPTLPQPMGPYKLGTKIFRWVDPNRPEEITADTLDLRNVIVQAWYPTNPQAKGNSASYLDGLGMLPNEVGMIPGVVFDRYDRIDTHAVLDALISNDQSRWPVVIFLTGNASSRSFYTGLITHIASMGFVVVAIDHPYDALITQLPDGTVVTNIERNLTGENNLLKFMALRVQTRIADVQFVLDQLDENTNTDPLLSHLDLSRIVVAGHSLGGATGAMAMAVDPRIKAAVNIDGTTYGDLPETPAPHPFMLIESKKDNSDRFLRYEQGNQLLFQHFGGGYRYELTDADHYSFTDVPYLLTSPARSLVGFFFGVGNASDQTSRFTADVVASFFSNALEGNSIHLDPVVEKYENVVKKEVGPSK